MTIAEQQRREQARYQEVLPDLVRGIEEGDEPVALAERLAERSGLEERLMYKWVQITEKALEQRRRRAAIGLAALLWIAALCIAGVLIGWVVSWFPVRAAGPVAVLAIGIALVAWTTFRLRGVRARAYRRWLAEEQDAAEPDEP